MIKELLNKKRMGFNLIHMCFYFFPSFLTSYPLVLIDYTQLRWLSTIDQDLKIMGVAWVDVTHMDENWKVSGSVVLFDVLLA